jgi:hypothetical protein
LTAAGVSRAFVVENGRVEERVVTVLERTATEVLVGQGVSAGQTLATSGLDHLTDGSAVTATAIAAPAPTSQGG